MDYRLVRDQITGLYIQIPIEDNQQEQVKPKEPEVIEEWDEEVDNEVAPKKTLKPAIKRC